MNKIVVKEFTKYLKVKKIFESKDDFKRLFGKTGVFGERNITKEYLKKQYPAFNGDDSDHELFGKNLDEIQKPLCKKYKIEPGPANHLLSPRTYHMSEYSIIELARNGYLKIDDRGKRGIHKDDNRQENIEFSYLTPKADTFLSEQRNSKIRFYFLVVGLPILTVLVTTLTLIFTLIYH